MVYILFNPPKLFRSPTVSLFIQKSFWYRKIYDGRFIQVYKVIKFEYLYSDDIHFYKNIKLED